MSDGTAAAPVTEACQHIDLDLDINHRAFADTNGHFLDIKGSCRRCGRRLRFRGAMQGLSPHQPTMDSDGFTIRVPFVGDGEAYVENVVHLPDGAA